MATRFLLSLVVVTLFNATIGYLVGIGLSGWEGWQIGVATLVIVGASFVVARISYDLYPPTD